MRKLCSVIFQLFAVTMVVISFPAFSFAQDTTSETNIVSISDAVTADLAVKGYLDNISVSYNDGDAENNIKINDTKHWLPASTIKLFAAMYAFKQIHDQKLHTWDGASVDEKNVVPTELVNDALPTIQSGDYLTIDRLITQMITQSDNTAFNVLLDILDRQKVTEYIHSLGLTHSAVGSKLNLDDAQTQYEFDIPGYGINTTTAEDYTKAFLLIKNKKITGAQDLFAILKQQRINTMLPLFLPKDTIVAHKHGDLAPLYHDGGIIISHDNKLSYVVSIFSNLGDPTIIAHLSELIYTRNYDLVGVTSEQPTHQDNITPPIDPLVAQGTLSKKAVLGTNTQDIQSQPITAADLGISAKDLSLVHTNNLPYVLIPADSPFHFLVPIWQSIRKVTALTPEAKRQADLKSLSLQLAEAKDEKDKGNLQLANELFKKMQTSLISQAQVNAIRNDPAAQNMLQSLSDTRFSVLGDELKNAKKDQRIGLIKEIAQQAKSTLKDIQPYLPEASNATNPSQKPLVGEIIQITSSTATVKTPSGQEVIIPIDTSVVKIHNDQITPSPTVTPPIGLQSTGNPSSSPVLTPTPAPFHVGATVALIGSSNGQVFTPSFILTNVPLQLIAPQPVVVLKVNTKTNTMVVSENGVPIQADITKQTIIKGTDTGISLQSIKPNDVVVIHGTLLTPPSSNNSVSVSPTGILPTTQTTGTITGIQSNTTQRSIHITGVLSQTPTKSVSANITITPPRGVTTNNFPAASGGQHTNLQPTQKIQPQVIQTTSVQVIEKATDVKTPSVPSKQNSQPQKTTSNQAPAQTHQQSSTQQTSQKVNTVAPTKTK